MAARYEVSVGLLALLAQRDVAKAVDDHAELFHTDLRERLAVGSEREADRFPNGFVCVSARRLGSSVKKVSHRAGPYLFL